MSLNGDRFYIYNSEYDTDSHDNISDSYSHDTEYVIGAVDGGIISDTEVDTGRHIISCTNDNTIYAYSDTCDNNRTAIVIGATTCAIDTATLIPLHIAVKGIDVIGYKGKQDLCDPYYSDAKLEQREKFYRDASKMAAKYAFRCALAHPQTRPGTRTSTSAGTCTSMGPGTRRIIAYIESPEAVFTERFRTFSRPPNVEIWAICGDASLVDDERAAREYEARIWALSGGNAIGYVGMFSDFIACIGEHELIACWYDSTQTLKSSQDTVIKMFLRRLFPAREWCLMMNFSPRGNPAENKSSRDFKRVEKILSGRSRGDDIRLADVHMYEFNRAFRQQVHGYDVLFDHTMYNGSSNRYKMMLVTALSVH
jgi:hypothetical protein